MHPRPPMGYHAAPVGSFCPQDNLPRLKNVASASRTTQTCSQLDRCNRECHSTFGNAHTRQFAGDVTNGCSRPGADAPSAAETERFRSITIAHDSVGPPPHRRCPPWAPKPSLFNRTPGHLLSCSWLRKGGAPHAPTPLDPAHCEAGSPPATPWGLFLFHVAAPHGVRRSLSSVVFFCPLSLSFLDCRVGCC